MPAAQQRQTRTCTSLSKHDSESRACSQPSVHNYRSQVNMGVGFTFPPFAVFVLVELDHEVSLYQPYSVRESPKSDIALRRPSMQSLEMPSLAQSGYHGSGLPPRITKTLLGRSKVEPPLPRNRRYQKVSARHSSARELKMWLNVCPVISEEEQGLGAQLE